MIVTPVCMSRNMNSPSVWINLLKCNWATFIYICWNWIFLLLLSYLLIHDFATCLYLLKHEFSFSCFYLSAEIQLYHLFLSKEMWTFPLFLSIYWKMIGPPVYNYWEINVLSVLTCLLKDKLPAWFFFFQKDLGQMFKREVHYKNLPPIFVRRPRKLRVDVVEEDDNNLCSLFRADDDWWQGIVERTMMREWTSHTALSFHAPPFFLFMCVLS